MQFLYKLRSSIHSFENGLLVTLVTGMLCLSVTQIFLRNFFEFGIVWAETLTRLMVLWTAMIGSMIAARSSKHVSIDLVWRFGKGKAKDIVLGIVQLATALLCLALVYYSAGFLLMEYEDGTEAFADIPSWIFITIIPVSFMVMGVRYLVNAGLHFCKKAD